MDDHNKALLPGANIKGVYAAKQNIIPGAKDKHDDLQAHSACIGA
jgi:hypothetical protein